MRKKILLTAIVVGLGCAVSFYLNMTMPDKADDMAVTQPDMVDPETGQPPETQTKPTDIRLYERIVTYADGAIFVIAILLLMTIWKEDLLALKKPKADIISASTPPENIPTNDEP